MARGTIITKTLENGDKRYVTVIRLNGKQVWKTFKRRVDADTYLNRNSTDAQEGTYREIKKGTFEQYAAAWRKKNLIPQELKYSTLSGYSYVLDRHIIPYFKGKAVAGITTADITDFRAAMLKGGQPVLDNNGEPIKDKVSKPQSLKSVKNLLNLLSRFFADAIEDGFAKMTPMPQRRRKADKKTKADRKGRALQPGEAQRILEQCDDTLRVVVLLGLLAGMRRGEIFALAWSSIDWDKSLIHVRQNLYYRHGKHLKEGIPEGEAVFILSTPKSDKSVRDVDLSPALKKELRKRLLQSTDKHGLIFQSSNATPLDPHNVYERWFKPAVERARKKAEEEKDKAAAAALDGLRMHDLRHTFGSWKVDQGEDIVYVSAQMGHAKPSITYDVYSHILDKRRPSAAAQTDAFLFGAKVSTAAD